MCFASTTGVLTQLFPWQEYHDCEEKINHSLSRCVHKECSIVSQCLYCFRFMVNAKQLFTLIRQEILLIWILTSAFYNQVCLYLTHFKRGLVKHSLLYSITINFNCNYGITMSLLAFSCPNFHKSEIIGPVWTCSSKQPITVFISGKLSRASI